MRNPEVFHPVSPYGGTDSYTELDSHDQQFKAFDAERAEPRVWTDEVSANDEKVLTQITEDGILHTSLS